MTIGEGALVSVVTPVYNGARFLRSCIESVLSQTYPHWDYTIVNNCSSDRTLEIAEEYSRQDARIRVRSNTTVVRVIANHNIAISAISPESRYCKVLAADDQMFPECLEKMVDLAEQHPNVAIVGAYGIEGSKVCWTGLSFPSPVVSGREMCRARLLGGPYIFGTPTAVLLRSDVVRKRCPFYNESNIHADSEACFQVLEEHDFGFVHQILTCQGIQDDSLTAWSGRMQTYLASVLYELVTFGPKYLGPEELQGRMRAHLGAYYRYLGIQVYKRRGREFWSFHRSKLAAAGYPLSRRRVGAAALLLLLDMALNPKRTTEEALDRLSGFRSRGSG